MSKLKVQAFAISIDGYGAGPRQSLEAPCRRPMRRMWCWSTGELPGQDATPRV